MEKVFLMRFIRIKIVRKKYNLYIINLYIELSYELLMKEIDNFYRDNSLQIIDESKLNNILENKILLDNIYYSLDGHNFFKRKYRFKHKAFLIICFGYFSLFNLFEFIESFTQIGLKTPSNNFNNFNRIATLTINMINLGFILILTTYTVVKLKVQTIIYY